jgi:hypothetical protein
MEHLGFIFPEFIISSIVFHPSIFGHLQGSPFRSVPGARISVRSVPFRSAAFHVVWKPACKDVTCV